MIAARLFGRSFLPERTFVWPYGEPPRVAHPLHVAAWPSFRPRLVAGRGVAAKSCSASRTYRNPRPRRTEPASVPPAFSERVSRNTFLSLAGPGFSLSTISTSLLETPTSQSVLLTIRILAWHEEIEFIPKGSLRERQGQNTNRILDHGHRDHGGNRSKDTVSMKSRMQFCCPAIEPLVLRTTYS